MLVVAGVEAGVVDVEGVGVLHDELADAQQAGLGAGLVAELGLDLVPDLRELLVAAELVARDGGHDLFVGHGEAELGAFAVLEAEHVVAHDGQRPDSSQSSRGFRAGRKNSWPILSISSRTMAMILLSAALAEREVAVDAGAELADVAGAEQELVAGDFGVGGGFTEGGDKEL